MFCLGHISGNTTVKSMNIFFDHITEHFDIEELLVNIYFNLIILPKIGTSLKSLYIKWSGISFILFNGLDCQHPLRERYNCISPWKASSCLKTLK